MGEYYQNFCKLMGIKSHPNDYEISLFQKTQKYSRFISWIPGLKMVAVCNSLSMYATKTNSSVIASEIKQSGAEGNVVENFYQYYPPDKGELKGVKKSELEINQDENNPPTPLIRGALDRELVRGTPEGSDIDLFIITAPNRIWFVRVAITIIFQLLGVRRHGKKVKDRFCLSFFITENAMDFSQIAIENDIYLYYWIYFLKPIINKDSTYEHFIKANKKLGIDEINLHGDNKIYLVKTGKYLQFLDKCKILDFKNWVLKKFFLPKTLAHKKRLGDPYGIIVSDDMLKFTDNDRRVEIRDEILGN